MNIFPVLVGNMAPKTHAGRHAHAAYGFWLFSLLVTHDPMLITCCAMEEYFIRERLRIIVAAIIHIRHSYGNERV